MSCPTMLRLIIGTLSQDIRRQAPVASLESSARDLTRTAAAIETGAHSAAVRSLAGLAVLRALAAVDSVRHGWPTIAGQNIAAAEGIADAAEYLACDASAE